MEITWLKNEDNAIQYVYASAVPQKIPLDIFKEIVQSSKENCLPEFYVILCQKKLTKKYWNLSANGVV